jgi:hypothetical protein
VGRRSRKRRLSDSAVAERKSRSAVGEAPPRPAAARGDVPRRAPAPARADAPAAPRPAAPRRRRARLDEAPKAPWSPFPLVELCILIAIVLLVLGFVTRGNRGHVELAGGFTLMVLSVTELAVREHFAGYRSHSAMLAGIGAVGLAALLFFFAPIPRIVVLVISVSVFGVLMRALRAAFMRRSGGIGFRA